MRNLKRPNTPVIAVSKGGEIREAEKNNYPQSFSEKTNPRILNPRITKKIVPKHHNKLLKPSD